MSPTLKPKLPVDIYIRVSRVNDRAGESYQSPKVQEKVARAEIEAINSRAEMEDDPEKRGKLVVGEVFIDEDESGGKESRPAFDKMMQRIRTEQSGGVIVAKLSRLSRRVKHTMATIEEIETAGAVFISCSPHVDTSSDYGRFMLTIFAALNELELGTLTTGWKTSQAEAISRGVFPGVAPTGYRKIEGEKLVRDEALAPKVAHAFSMRKAGKQWADIARTLDGVETYGSRRARIEAERQGLPAPAPVTTWKGDNVKGMLTGADSVIYYGLMRRRHKGQTVEAHFPELGIVTTEDWQAVQPVAVEDAPVKLGRPGGSGGKLLSKVARCSECGGALTRKPHKGKNGTEYGYWACVNGRHLHPGVSVRVEAFALEDWATVVAFDRLAEMPVTMGEPLDVGKVTKMENALDKAGDSLGSFLKHAEPTDDGYGEKMAELRAARDAASVALSDYKARAGTKKVDVATVRELYDGLGLTDKQTVMRAVFNKIVVAPGASVTAVPFADVIAGAEVTTGFTVSGVEVELRPDPWSALGSLPVG